MKRQGMLLVEVMIAMLIIAVTAGAFSLSSDIWTVTAKREAERLAAKLNSAMNKADREHISFNLKIQNNEMRIIWQNPFKTEKANTEYLLPSAGCKYTWKSDSSNTATDKVVTYSYVTNKYIQGDTITINGRGPEYHVVIASIEGRVRIEPQS